MTTGIPSPRINWPLRAVPDSQGRLDFPSLEESIRQNIEVILSTRPGERLMRPSFGAGLQNFLDQPNNPGTRARIEERIVQGLARWEERIVLDRVDVRDDTTRPDIVRITIAYRVKRTGQAGQLHLSLGLENS